MTDVKIDQQGSHVVGAYQFSYISYVLLKCLGCSRGGFATIHWNERLNSDDSIVEEFYPHSIDHAMIPNQVPQGIVNEFREAERCMSVQAYRAASALFRSVLEKTLKANGYIKTCDRSLTDLHKRIDAAASDGIITEARRKRAHEEIRTLGNDVVHDDWREVALDEVSLSRHYTQRILEDLYGDRPTVTSLLVAKGRLKESPST